MVIALEEKEPNYKCPRCDSVNTVWHGWNKVVSGERHHKRKCNECGHTFYGKDAEIVYDEEVK